MQIRFAVLAAAALLAAPVAAQGGGAGGGGRPGGGAGGAARGGGFMAPAPDADQLVKQLKLSDESAAKVAKLVEAYKAETKGPQAWVDGIRASGDMQAMRSAPGAQDSLAKLRSARAKFDKELKAMLTPEQAKQYDEMQAAGRPRRPGS